MCQWVNVGTKSLFNYTGYETEQKHKKTRDQEKKKHFVRQSYPI